MASANFPLTSPTGANQYSDTNYALPALGGGAGSTARGGGTGYEMFTGASSYGNAAPAGGTGTPASTTPPGVVPPSSQPVNTTLPPGIQQGTTYTGPYDPNNPIGGAGGVKNVGSGAETVTTLF